MTEALSKVCAQCGKSKSLHEFSQNKTTKDGKCFYCRPCVKLKNASYHAAHREEKNAASRAYHAAHRQEQNQKSHDYRVKHRDRLLAYLAEYRRTHREELLIKKRADYLAHQEENIARAIAYRIANREIISLRRRAARLLNLEKERIRHRKYYETHKEVIYLRNALYHAAHPEIYRASHKRRRARKNNAPRNDFSHAQWQEVLIAFEHRCAYCPSDCKECKKKSHKLEQEHVTPYAHNGSNTLWNIVPACRTCNSRKHTGPPLVPVQPLLLTVAPLKVNKMNVSS